MFPNHHTAGLSSAFDPVASASGRFPLARPAGQPVTEGPSVGGARPWNLRRMGPVMVPTGRLAATSYDPIRQVSVGPDADPGGGVPFMAGPPTAPTTSNTDGEDPPSSEDYINDFHPDDMP